LTLTSVLQVEDEEAEEVKAEVDEDAEKKDGKKTKKITAKEVLQTSKK